MNIPPLNLAEWPTDTLATALAFQQQEVKA